MTVMTSIRSYAISFFCLFTLLPCCAQLARYSLDFSLSKKDFVDSIDISYRNGQVLIPVIIGDKEYRFLLDTGAGQAVVYSDRPIEGCQPAGRIISHDAVGHSDTVSMVTLPPMTIGSTVYSGCQATLQRRAVAHGNIDGIIGFDLVCKGLTMKIDVRQHLLVLTDRRRFFDREPGFSTRYRLNYHVPYIDVRPFAHFTRPALFDTGSRQLYSMNRQHFDEAEQQLQQIVAVQTKGRQQGRHAMGHQGAEASSEVVFLALSRLQIGGFGFDDVHAITTLGDSHVGARLLEYGAVVLSPRRRKFIFQPYEGGRHVVVSNPQLPISFVIERGQTVVGLVWERGPAYKAGFRTGDVVLHHYVDGTYILRDADGNEKTVKYSNRP